MNIVLLVVIAAILGAAVAYAFVESRPMTMARVAVVVLVGLLGAIIGGIIGYSEGGDMWFVTTIIDGGIGAILGVLLGLAILVFRRRRNDK